jgi:hypothetical protein
MNRHGFDDSAQVPKPEHRNLIRTFLGNTWLVTKGLAGLYPFFAVLVLVWRGAAGITWLTGFSVLFIVVGGLIRTGHPQQASPTIRLNRKALLVRLAEKKSQLEAALRQVETLEAVVAERYRYARLDDLRKEILGEVAEALVQYDRSDRRNAGNTLETLRRALTRMSGQ